eukprot:5102865-Pyramimonas_sp.AAC.1
MVGRRRRRGPQHRLQTASQAAQYVKGEYRIRRMISGYQRRHRATPRSFDWLPHQEYALFLPVIGSRRP